MVVDIHDARAACAEQGLPLPHAARPTPHAGAVSSRPTTRIKRWEVELMMGDAGEHCVMWSWSCDDRFGDEGVLFFVTNTMCYHAGRSQPPTQNL